MSEEKPEHSPTGASSMERWENCPGSVKLSKGLKSTDSAAAKEGTLAHEFAAKYLTSSDFNGSDVPNLEMGEAVRLYAETIYNDCLDKTFMKWVEVKFDLTQLYHGLYGTADCVVYLPLTKKLIVYDFKYGSGTFVEAEGNSQLMYYALGAALTLNLIILEVEIVIVQPRYFNSDGPIRRSAVSVLELIEFSFRLVEAARRTHEHDAPLLPGSWCRWCPAAGICPAIHGRALELAKLEFNPQGVYDVADLNQALTFLPILEGWIKSVRDFAYQQAQIGKTPAGWKLVAKRSVRKWAVSEKATVSELMRLGFSENAIFKKVLQSPTQIEMLMSKGTKYHLDFLVAKVSSGCVLVPESDKRKPLAITAGEEFQVINDE